MTEQDVLQMRQVAYVMAMSMSALARIEGMKAENAQREHLGYSMAYVLEDFEAVSLEFGTHHNAILSNLDLFR